MRAPLALLGAGLLAISLPAGGGVAQPEVDGFYWTDSAPDIVNSGREEQGLVSV
jgi:hypothetical protein